jgi:nucleotide-binding universal stress UspA family protein
MKKFLVPIDFSDTSVNAATYAVNLAKTVENSHITLYYVYNRISLATLKSKDEGSRQKVSEAVLETIKNKISDGFENIDYVAEEGSFVEMISDFTLGNKIDMVIMGITGSSRLSQVFMGTNTLNVIRHISCPVMVIPPQAVFTGLKKVVLTSDFKDVARTTPFVALRKIFDMFHPHIDILNVDSEHYVELTEEFKIEKEAMKDKLAEYDPEFSFLRAYDFLEGINLFVEQKKIDAIISVPRKHSFLSQLFKTSNTKKLAYHSTVPLITIP